jgi:ribonuclease P protein component
VLPNSARIKNSSDFARVTKSGKRNSTESLVGYLLLENSSFQPRLGLIVGKSIGNSVVRHRIARQIRHSVKDQLTQLPVGSMLVIRAMRTPTNAFLETKELLDKFATFQNVKVNA